MEVGEKVKNIFLEAAMNYDKMSDSEKIEVNDNVRKQFNNIINGKHPKTEREKKIDKLAREELEEYRRKKKAFMIILSIGITTSVEDMGFLY